MPITKPFSKGNCIVGSLFTVRLKDCLYLWSVFLFESFFCDYSDLGSALPCGPSLLPALMGSSSMGQQFFHLDLCCCSSLETPVLLPAWESHKSQKLWSTRLPLNGERSCAGPGAGTVRLWVWVSLLIFCHLSKGAIATKGPRLKREADDLYWRLFQNLSCY